jgi:hypothetical protein
MYMMYGRPLEYMQRLYLEEDEECDYDHTLLMILVHKVVKIENYSVGEDISNMCKNVVIKTEFMQSHVEFASHEDVELQSEL